MTKSVNNGPATPVSLKSSYDVVVVGGGPVGSVAAVAFARTGASVLLVEADPRAAKRFAGEWLHPPAVEVLDRLRIGRLEGGHARTGYGFVILPDDGSTGIEMPYPHGTALAAEHSEIVGALRRAVDGTSGIDYLPFARVRDLDGQVVRIERKEGSALEIRAGRVVGADGRSSLVREKLGIPENSQILSYMASVELRGVTLPNEGFGHVILGGPGPALFYRIADDVVRGCLDIPLSYGASARTPSFVWDAFSPVLPAGMRPAFRAALERGLSGWAANRFRPRTHFGKMLGGRSVALVGDAVGHVHPMTAMGMTLGFADVEALVESRSLEEYADARRAYVPEVLSNALYHCFRRDDAGAVSLRRAMFSTLRESEGERRRTMSILAGQDYRKRTFSSAFLRMAGRAFGGTAVSSAKDGKIEKLPQRLGALAEWMQWPAAMLVPGAVRERYRSASSSLHPIPALTSIPVLASILQGTETLTPAEANERRSEQEVDLDLVLNRGSDALVTELESIARQLGTIPDRVVALPAIRMMRAITSRTMRPALAARMTIGRRRLSVEGFSRLIEAGAPIETEALAGLVLLLLDGAAWAEASIAGLTEGLRILLTCERPGGGFGASTASAAPDLVSTMLACRALDVVIRRRPDATDADLEAVLTRAAEFVRTQQSDDGSFAGSVLETSWAIDALIAAEANPGDPAVRRATKWLASALQNGTPRQAGRLEGLDESTLAEAAALTALARSSAPAEPLRAKLAHRLVQAFESNPTLEWRDVAEIVESLAIYEAHRAGRPISARMRKGVKRNDGASAENRVSDAMPLSISEEDWAFCKQALTEVSRTFSKPIALLPPRLEVAVTLGYLLCRVADTVEDHAAVTDDVRGELFRTFLEVLEKDRAPSDFAAGFDAIPGDDAELSLARALPLVMRVYRAQSPSTIAISTRWVAEMSRGMDLYSRRSKGDDGFVALYTVSDLERYCYYVAGTVGHMLTELFVDEMRAGGMDARSGVLLERKLREDAESFATGLQLVNILKDVTDDRARHWSFIPRTSASSVGLGIDELVDPQNRKRAHAAVAPLFDVARAHLDGALRYALAIPPNEIGIRLFCLLPLWMAARTLVHGRGNDAMFVAGAPVKISRDEVEALVAECMANVSDNEALETRYAALYQVDPLEHRRRIA
jgi:squalene monooxygenase